MKTQAVIDHFQGVTALAEALRISPAAVSQWGEFPPPKRQLQLELLTGLKAETGLWQEVLGVSARSVAEARKRAKRELTSST